MADEYTDSSTFSGILRCRSDSSLEGLPSLCLIKREAGEIHTARGQTRAGRWAWRCGGGGR